MGTIRLCVTFAVLAGFAAAQYAGVGQGQGQGQGQGGGQQQQIPDHGFLPQQHPNCGYKQACIYWEYCVNNQINIYGIGELDVRLFGSNPIPAEYSGQKCPVSDFAVCCEIPNEIWTGPQWLSVCNEEHHTCVPKYQCLNGEINTSGIGLLDVRLYGGTTGNIKTPQNCTSSDPRYAAVPAECCKLPDPVPLIGCPGDTVCLNQGECGNPIPTNANGVYDECYTNTATVETGVCCNPRVPDPVYICPTDQVCVDRGTCTAGGTVNTNGAGLIDIRINVPCYVDENTEFQGVCCNPPISEIRSVCPGSGSHICVDASVCVGSSLIDAFGRPVYCDLGGGSTGTCCETTEPVNVCSNTNDFACVNPNLCGGNNLLDIYGSPKTCYNSAGGGELGVCCENPVLTSCSTDTSYFCTAQNTCQDPILVDPQTSLASRCYIGGTNDVGECCQTPHVNTCGQGDVCVHYGECAGITVANNYGNELYCALNATTTGTCCTPLTCHGTHSCLTSDRCDPVKTPDTNAASDCYLPDFTLGKCCEPIPEPIIDTVTCQSDSVCLPDVLCQGEILAKDGSYYSYTDQSYTWSQCQLSGTTLGISGVCCRNSEIIEPELPNPAQKCGVRNLGLDQRIQNNELINYQAQFAEFPWQAIIFFTNFTFKCGASLIGDGWLLTAAHCVDGYTKDDLMIRLGEWKVDSYDEIGQYVDVGIHSIYVHPDYKPKILHNDIALIRLAKSVIFKYHINAVCLPEVGQVFYDQTRCFATGWGKDAFDGGLYQVIMKKVDLPLVNKQECQSYLRQTRLGKFFQLHNSFLCAGGEEGKDACEGDGGGPLVCQDPSTGQYVQVGITAWGIGCGSQNVPGVFVDVEFFRTWINGILFSNEAQQVYGK